MKKIRKRYKAIRHFTPFERAKTKDIQELIDSLKINPLEVESVSIGGQSRYTYEDIFNYMELTALPFDAEVSHYTRKRGDKSGKNQ